MVQDITERQRTMKALEASEQQLRTLVRTAPVIIFATDAVGVFTMTDGKGLEDIALAPGMRVGQSALETKTEGVARAVARALRGEDVSDTFEMSGILFDHHYTPVRDRHGKITGVVGVSINVQEQRRLEEQLCQAKKMEAVGRLAGGIAHDFNNVLSVITGYTELALLSVSESHPLYGSLSEIKQAGQSAAALPRQLLAFSRRQVLEPEIVNLAEVVAELEPMLRCIIEEDVKIETHLDPIGCTVQADPGQIEQVIMNLVVNARDAMADGGVIPVRAEPVDAPTGSARSLASTRAGRYVVLSVSDEGHGMDAETRERVFEPFFTTKDVGEGTDLGLATVYGIVNQSNGAIEIDSEPGQGAAFRVYFPAAELPAATTDTDEPRGSPRGTERVLLVEDEDAVRSIVERVLLNCGYNVATAISGQEALDFVAREHFQADLLFTDIVMPGMRGPELARRLRELNPSLRVLFTSGYVGDEPVQLDAQGPGAAYLQKPVGYADIARKVREVLDAPVASRAPRSASPS